MLIQVGENLEIKDSCLFLNSSLAKLTKNLMLAEKAMSIQGDSNLFPNLHSKFGDIPMLIALLKEKQPMFYEYLSKDVVLDEEELPPIERFYDNLNQKACSQADYAHAQEVWRVGNCHTIRDYLKLYLEV